MIEKPDNTLAYNHEHLQITDVKSFITFGLDGYFLSALVDSIKTFMAKIYLLFCKLYRFVEIQHILLLFIKKV
jgi:hypothetical protein